MLKIRSTFLKNWLALSSSDLICQVLSFLSMFRVARHLAPEGYGTYGLIVSTASLFSLLAILGLSQVIVVEVAKNKDASRSILRSVLRIRALSVPVILLLLVAYYCVIKKEMGVFVLFVTAVSIVNACFVDVFENIAFGRQVMKYTSALNVANAVVWVAGLYVIPLRYLSLEVILLFYVGLQAVRTAVYFLIEWRNRFFVPMEEVSGITTRHLIKMGLPYYWMNIVGTATVQLPVILLGLFSGSREVGLYNAGYRLVMPMSLVLNGMSRAIFPKLVEVRQGSLQSLRDLVYNFLSLLVFLGAALAAVITAASREIVLLTVGPEYAPAVPSFVNQIWFLYIYSVFIVMGFTLASLEQQRVLALLATCGSLISVGFVYVGAHRGAYGLSGLILLSYLLNLTYHFWVVERKLGAGMKPALVLRNVAVILLGLLLSRFLLATESLWMRLGAALVAGLIGLPLFRAEMQVIWSRLIAPKEPAVVSAG